MPDDTSHECPHPQCNRRLPFERLACPIHWRQLPGSLKRAVTVAWREGDVAAHVKARADAVAWWNR